MDCWVCGHDWEKIIADDVSRRQYDEHLLVTERNLQRRFAEEGFVHDIKWETLSQRLQWAGAHPSIGMHPGHQPSLFRVETK